MKAARNVFKDNLIIKDEMYHLILGLTTALLDRQKKIVLPEDIMHIMNLMSGYMSSFSNNFVVGSKTWTGSYHQIVIKLH